MLHLIKRSSIITKILFFFISLIFFVNVILFHTIQLSKRNIDEKTVELLKSKAEFAFKNMEDELVEIRDKHLKLINDLKLFRVSITSHSITQYEFIDIINFLHNDIRTMAFEYETIEDTSLYIPTIGKHIHINQIYSTKIDDLLDFYKKLMQNTNDRNIFFLDGKPCIVANNVQYQVINGIIVPNSSLVTVISTKKSTDIIGELFDKAFTRYAFYLTDTYESLSGNDNGEDSSLIDKLRFLPENEAVWQNYMLDFSDEKYCYFAVQSPRINIGLILAVDKSIFYLKDFSMLFLVVSIFVCVIIVSFFLIIRFLIKKPISIMMKSFKRVEDGDLKFTLDYKRTDEFSFLYHGFNNMLEQLRQLVHEVYEHKILSQESQLRQLQYQINPHFLYNSLLVLYETIKFGDEENAKIMTKSLSSYYQFITKNKKDKIPLSMEMQHIYDYVNILMIRHGNRIRFEVGDVPEGFENFEVPALILQPIVENAYKYGMNSKEEDGIIRLTFNIDEAYVIILIEDNGEDLTDKTIEKINNDLNSTMIYTNGTGIINVHRRLKLLMGENSGISVSRSELGGLRVALKIEIKGDQNV